MESHLLQMRGLKHVQKWLKEIGINVASFTDAWIETIGASRRQKRAMSHLLQMRGLKRDYVIPATGASIGRIFYRCVD